VIARERPAVQFARIRAKCTSRHQRGGSLIRGIPALGLALAVAACGGSGVSPHFAASANAICKATNRQIESLPVPGNSAPSEARTLRKGFGYAAAELSKLDQLTAPSRKEPTYVTGLAAARRLVILGRAEVADFAHGKTAAAGKLLDEGDAISGERDAAMSIVGASQCADDPQPAGSS
jgi:hypothetical protein